MVLLMKPANFSDKKSEIFMVGRISAPELNLLQFIEDHN